MSTRHRGPRGTTAARAASRATARTASRAIAAAGAVAAAVAVVVVAAGGCASDGAGSGDDGAAPALVVSAASSLTDGFGELVERFEADRPGTEVLLNLDASSSLAGQALAGAPVDVLASAGAGDLQRVVDGGLVEGVPVAFATNELVIVTGPGNPAGIGGPGDLEAVTGDGGVVALCAAEAPCGRLADEVLRAGGVSLPEDRVTRAPNARATLGAVRRGDAAAAMVYATDARSAGADVATVDLGDAAVATDYLVAVLTGGDGDPAAAREFVDLVTSAEGREVLEAEGFG